jgi:hypothetical protein
MLFLGIAVTMVMLFVVGCGSGASTPVSEAPAAASTPESAAATSPPEPPAATPTPVPPTETPTPSFANPQPGATFTGDIKSSETKDKGTINLIVSEDGTSITQVDVTVMDYSPECSGGSISGTDIQTLFFYGPFPITESNIEASISKDGKLKGKFTSPTEASGTIDLVTEFSVLGSSMTCDFGTWEWGAKANAPTRTPAIAKPQPGATFTGPMEISQPGSERTAKGGSLEFTITEDGNAIASVSITVTESKCSVTSEGVTYVTEVRSSTTSFEGPFPIAEGKIDATFDNSRKLKGQFTSPTEANGTIDVVQTTVVGLGKLVNCDLGEWNWSAKAGGFPETPAAKTSITETPAAEENVPDLLQALRDEDEFVRMDAVEALVGHLSRTLPLFTLGKWQ